MATLNHFQVEPVEFSGKFSVLIVGGFNFLPEHFYRGLLLVGVICTDRRGGGR
jgi:hypothetical protein